MKVLCDSHILVWWLDNPSKLLSKRAQEILRDPENEVFFSAASVWELGLKIAKGKLLMPSGFVEVLQNDGFAELPVRSEHAVKATVLPAIHGDPFDRMLVAQTLAEKMVLITRDHAILEYDVPFIEG
jgi:PIN domain nuclease of toxin-antitoxin system